MLLTTHSMEEADLLADTIAIMVHGRCVAGAGWCMLMAGGQSCWRMLSPSWHMVDARVCAAAKCCRGAWSNTAAVCCYAFGMLCFRVDFC